ncbi:MAG: TetR/AcrR family transcriptional regulator [Halioglobus sp.]
MTAKKSGRLDLPPGDLGRADGRPATKEARDRERVERLTVAAFDLFTQRGYHNTPIDVLCTAANVSTRDFYKLGKTREKLMALVYRRVTRYAELCVLRALADAPENDSTQRIPLAIEAWVHAYTHDERYARLAYLESVGISDELEALRTEAHEVFSKVIRDEILRLLPDSDVTLESKLPVALVGACNELTRDWLATKPRPPAKALEDAVKNLYDVVLHGLRA